MPACSRICERAPSAPTKSRAEIVPPPASVTSIVLRPYSKAVTAPARRSTPSSLALLTSASTSSLFSIMCANGSPSATSPPKVRKVGRTASSSLESVTTMSRIGCACPSTASQTSIASNRRRAAAAIAEARGSFDGVLLSAGSATVTVKASPSAWRSAMASARPAKPAPPITTSRRSVFSTVIAAILVTSDTCASLAIFDPDQRTAIILD